MNPNTLLRRKIANDQVSGLDWALLTLLQSVRAKFVDKMKTHWDQGLKEMDNALKTGQLNEGQERFAHNLYNALILTDPSANKPDYRERYSGWISDQIEDLRTQLERSESRLFNSYYFITISSYGDPDEYFFFPIVPGRSSLPSREMGPASQKLGDYFSGLDLPFVPPTRFAEYTGTLLPGRVGLTPQICLIARKEHGGLPEAVPLFLGDFAAIGKAEDVAQRHHSAVVAPLIAEDDDKRHCLGAFVATSVVPDAFNGSFGRIENLAARELLKVIKDWRKAPLRQLHASARRESRDAIVSLQWPKLETAKLDTLPLEAATEAWLHELGEHGAAALQSHDGATKSAICAINPDSLAMSLRSSLTPGPLLASSVYTVDDPPLGVTPDPSDPLRPLSVSNAKLSQLLSELAKLGASSQPLRVVGTHLFHRQIKDFTQLTAHDTSPDDLLIRSIRKGDVSAAAIYAAGENKLYKSIEKNVERLALQALEDSEKQRRPLPGERQSIYPELERLYHRAVHDSSPATDRLRNKSYRIVEELLATEGVIGVLLFEHNPIYVADSCRPEGTEAWPQPLSHAVFNPASYWVFEQICQLATMESFPVDRVGPDTDYFNPAPFVASHILGQGPEVNVLVSDFPERNQKAISALNYLGVPVTSWTQDKTKRHFAIPSDVGKGIAEFYRGYLRNLLLDTCNVPAIDRAIRTAHGASKTAHGTDESVSIDKIDMQLAAPKAERIQFDFHCRVGDESKTVSSVWRRKDTMRLEFSAFNVQQLADSKAKHIAVTLRSTEPTKAKAWSPRQGWAPTELHQGYLEAFDRAKESLEQQDALRSYLNTHESHALLQSLNDLIVAGESAGGDLAAIARDARLERDLFLLQTGQVIEGLGSFAHLGKDLGKDLRFLAEIGSRHGVTAANDQLFQGGILLDGPAWRATFANLLVSRVNQESLRGLAVHDVNFGSARAKNVLLLDRLLSSTFKHSFLDLAPTLERSDDGFLRPDLQDPSWIAFAEHLEVGIDAERISISNLCAEGKRGQSFKQNGTYRVLKQYLTDERAWGDGVSGRISHWGVVDPTAELLRFKVELTLPPNFWRRTP